MKLVMDDGREYTVESVRTDELTAADILVFKTQERLSYEGKDRFLYVARKIFPGARVTVLDGSLDLSIVRGPES